MKKALLKLTLFSCCVLVLSFIPKLLQHYFKPSTSLRANISNTNNCFFVGSSRIALGINTALLKQHINTTDFYNLGVYGQAFNYSLPIAHKLMSHQQNSLIYIELTRIKPINTVNNYNYLSYPEKAKADITYLNTLPSFGVNNLHTFFKSMEAYLFNTLSIKTNLAALSHNPSICPNTGIQKTKMQYNGSTKTFLRPDELVNTPADIEGTNDYIRLINTTIEKAVSSNTKIVFILPITFRDDHERKILLSVYKHIPEKYKTTYPLKFLETISNTKYLNHPFHFNHSGAELYTTLILEDIKKRL